MVAVFGTMAADVLHIVIGVPYLASTVFFGVSLCVIFALWYGVEKTLSIHSIDTWRREIFYWATVMATFALGTAAGDMTAVTLHLGYLDSGVLFAGLIALVTAAHYAAKGVLDLEHRQQSRNAYWRFGWPTSSRGLWARRLPIGPARRQASAVLAGGTAPSPSAYPR